MITFITVVLAAIIFEYSNGFHDAANAIATVVLTKVLTRRQAIAMAAVFNLTGALLGGAVASTIGKGLVDTNVVMMSTVLCALIAAITWNLLTWWVSGVKWTVVERIIWAWVLTVPATALLGYILSRAAAHGLAGEGDFSSRLNRHPTVARS